MNKNWYEYKSKVQSFQFENEPELIHIIKMGSTDIPNTYILVYDTMLINLILVKLKS